MKKNKPMDGLGPYEIAKIRSALRQTWHRSLARKLAVKRCTGQDGFPVCEKCFKIAAKIKIDHIIRVGDIDDGYIERLFCPSNCLQVLCEACHREKTKEERSLSNLRKSAG